MTIHPRSKCLWAVVVAGATIAPGAAHAVESASPRISPEFAAARAVNDLSVAPGGFTLRNPRHAASFDAEEVVVTPRRGPAWTWRFTAANAADASRVPAVADPASPDPLTVTYHRGPLDEIYRCEAGHIEQEFRLTEGFALSGPDLVIAGTVECAGDLRRCEQGWVWSTEEGVVSLGNVRVFDATGRSLSAAMSVDGSELRIVVGGDDLRTATFPVTVDPEIGTNDFRLSDMGPDGDITFDGFECAVAYNNLNNEFLVVWEGDDDVAGLSDGEFEIFGQRIDGTAGGPLGANDFRISDMGPDGVLTLDAVHPAVTYNRVDNEYLVVWSGDDGTPPLVDGEFEIFGQRLAGTTGAEIGANDFRISSMGPDGNPLFDASDPDVVYDAILDQYLVVWSGDDVTDDEHEIHGQRLAGATGAEIGADDFRVSDMGPDGDPLFDAEVPRAALSTSAGEYLVVWQGDDDSGLRANGEFEIHGQRITASTGAEVGANDFRISDMGPDGDIDFDARSPAIAYDGDRNQYLVVWEGDDDAGTLVDGETEIFGQRVDALTGAELGSGDFRISDMGPDGDPLWDAQKPAVAYNPVNREFLVVWSGEDDAAGLANGEFEIYAQRIAAATGAEIGTNDFRISDMGPDGDPLFDALDPSVAFNAAGDEYLVVWAADDLAGTQVEGETEIFGQRLAGATGAEIGTNDFRITDVGPDGDPLWDAAVPQVAYNPAGAEYLVVFAAEDNIGLLANGEFEIYGQRLGAAGAQIGANDFRISSAGVDGDATYDAFAPAVAFDPVSNRYLVVWEGEDTVGLLAPDENEIFGQLLGAGGVEVGPDDFRISDMGPDGDPFFDAEKPSVAYNTTDHEFLVTWTGDDDTLPIVDGEKEVWVQRVDANGLQPGINDERLSDVGPNGDPNEDAEESAVAYASPGSRFLVVWRGDDDLGGPLGTNEFEIYGQLFSNMLPVDVATVLPPIGPGMRLAVTPNPARDDAHISLTAPSTGPVEVTVVDVAGRVRFSRVVPSAPSGRIELDLPSHRLASGVYFVRAAGRGLRESTKLTVLR